MDRQKRRSLQIGRRPMLVVMAQARLCVTELCQLRWRAVDIHHERPVVERAKTDAAAGPMFNNRSMPRVHAFYGILEPQ